MTQKEQVLEILNEHRTQFTQLDAIREIGCLRLSERIRELEKDGIEIEHEAISVPNRNGRECRVMSYRLKQPAEDDGTCHCGSGCVLGTCPNCDREIGAIR